MRILRLLLPFLSLLFAACPDHRKVEVRIGINPWPGYEFFYLAAVKDFYAEKGVAVTIVEYNSLADALTAFERHQVDAIGCTIVETALARHRNQVRPTIACVPDYSRGADVVIGGKGISHLSKLKGRRVAVETGSLGIYLLSRALETEGLTLHDVVVVPSDQLSIETGLLAGTVDAAVSYPPFATRILSHNETRTLFDSAAIPGEICDTLIFNETFVKEHPGILEAVVSGFFAARRYTEAQPTDAYAIMAKREQIGPADLQNSLATGLYLPSEREQAVLLAPEGPVERALVKVTATLKAVGEIK